MGECEQAVFDQLTFRDPPVRQVVLRVAPGKPVSLFRKPETTMFLVDSNGLDFHDSLIIAVAPEAGSDTLLTEELRTGPRLGRLLVESPLI